MENKKFYANRLRCCTIGFGLNESTTTTTQDNDMMDLNGEGFPGANNAVKTKKKG